jgi:hypothetical protein
VHHAYARRAQVKLPSLESYERQAVDGRYADLLKLLLDSGRYKPKGAYDLCYCLEHFPDGMKALAAGWKNRRKQKDVARAIEILREKFASVDAFGPGQVVEFHGSTNVEEQAMQARRAFEITQQYLSYL